MRKHNPGYLYRAQGVCFRTCSVAVTIPVIEITPCYTNPSLGFQPVKIDTRPTTMASSYTASGLRSSSSTKDALARENKFLRGRLREVEEELRQARIKLGENRIWKSEEEEMEARRNPWRTPSPEEERFPRETSKRSLEDLVAQVVDGGKKRKVGGSFDPEKGVGKGIPRMVKVGGVRWSEGIGGVEAALREAGVGFCEGTRWLVGEEGLDKRRKRGGLVSTVVVRVVGEEVVRQLGRAGIWVGGYWWLVKKFVAVQLRRKEAGWMKVMDGIKSHVEFVTDRLEEKEKKKEKEEERKGPGKGIAFGERDMKMEELVRLGGKMEGLEKLVLSLGRELARKKGDWTRKDDRMEKERAVEEEKEILREEKKEEKERSRVSVFTPGMEWKPSGPGLFG